MAARRKEEFQEINRRVTQLILEHEGAISRAYQEEKHCWSVRTQSSLIKEPPHTCTFLEQNFTFTVKPQMRAL